MHLSKRIQTHCAATFFKGGSLLIGVSKDKQVGQEMRGNFPIASTGSFCHQVHSLLIKRCASTTE